MHNRFYVEKLGDSDKVRLSAGAAHHLRVLGLKPGDEVVLFDGSGVEARGRVEDLSRGGAVVKVVSRETAGREGKVRLTIACAVPRGERMDTLVRMCAELGVARIVPLMTRRSVVKLSAEDSSHKLDRLRKICVSASEQSGRSIVTAIAPPATLEELLASRDPSELGVLLSADASAPTLPHLLRDFAGGPLLILVGPEGDFTPEEKELALSRGLRAARLTESILRVETAAIAAAAIAMTADS